MNFVGQIDNLDLKKNGARVGGGDGGGGGGAG